MKGLGALPEDPCSVTTIRLESGEQIAKRQHTTGWAAKAARNVREKPAEMAID